MDSRFTVVNGVRLHYVERGIGPPIVLLHGFPDFCLGWRRQLTALANAGFRAIAMDLRGYGKSSRPAGVESYAMHHLCDDVVAFARTLPEQPVIVGHDWGGVIAWRLGMHHAETMKGLVIINAPHPRTFARELRRVTSSQKFRSWYAAFFQLPRLPELVLGAGRGSLLRRMLAAGPARRDDTLDAYLEAFGTPGALTAAINYYRAIVRHPPGRVRPIPVRTLLIWGKRDPYLVPQLVHGLEGWVPRLQTQVIPRGGHWVHHSHADEVNAAISSFARGCEPSA